MCIVKEMHVMAKANYPMEQVRRGKARYCRCVDTRQWDELAALFVPEPTIEMLDPDGNTIAALAGGKDLRALFATFSTARAQATICTMPRSTSSPSVRSPRSGRWKASSSIPPLGLTSRRGCTAMVTITKHGSIARRAGASRACCCAGRSSKSLRIKGISP